MPVLSLLLLVLLTVRQQITSLHDIIRILSSDFSSMAQVFLSTIAFSPMQPQGRCSNNAVAVAPPTVSRRTPIQNMFALCLVTVDHLMIHDNFPSSVAEGIYDKAKMWAARSADCFDALGALSKSV